MTHSVRRRDGNPDPGVRLPPVRLLRHRLRHAVLSARGSDGRPPEHIRDLCGGLRYPLAGRNRLRPHRGPPGAAHRAWTRSSVSEVCQEVTRMRVDMTAWFPRRSEGTAEPPARQAYGPA